MTDYSKYSDEKLLALLNESSPLCDQAFDIIYKRYSSRLNVYCIFRSNNKSDAEETFADTWMKFIDRIRKGKQLNNILPYLFSIARTITIDKYRKKQTDKNIDIVYKEFDEMERIVDPFEFQNQLENEELLSMVKIAISNLDDIYQESFVLHWFGGMKYNEIAEILEISIDSVKMRCHRAMKMLIKILRPYYIEASK